MFPLLVVAPYIFLVTKLAVDTWPKAGTGGGLEFLLNLLVAAPLSFVFAGIAWGVRPVANVGAHGFLLVLVFAGIVQAVLIWWLMLRGIGRRRSK